MSELELLTKSWQEQNIEVVKLESKGDKHLFQTSRWYEYKWNYYRDPPVFQVFNKGKRILVTESYRLAYSKWASI